MRHGFTMIELLVVLVIIGILVGITFAVYTDSLTAARVESTRATITQLDAAVQDRMEAFNRVSLQSQAQQFKRAYDPYDDDNDPTTPPVPINNPPVIPIGLAELLVTKDRYRAAFPQRVEDLWGWDGVPDTIDDAPLWSVWKQETGATAGNPRPAPHTIDTESTELLLLSLKNSFGLPVQPLDIKPSDIDGDGLPEVLDDWGNAIRFYNWPTGLVRSGDFQDIVEADFLQTSHLIKSETPRGDLKVWDYRSGLNVDPQDPTGLLSLMLNGEDLNNNGSLDTDDLDGDGTIDMDEDLDQDGSVTPGSYQNIRSGFMLRYRTGIVNSLPFTEGNFHALNTYHRPILVSAGADGELGLEEPTGSNRSALPLNFGATQDNVAPR